MVSRARRNESGPYACSLYLGAVVQNCIQHVGIIVLVAPWVSIPKLQLGRWMGLFQTLLAGSRVGAFRCRSAGLTDASWPGLGTFGMLR